MEEIQTNKNKTKNDKVCQNCEWYIPTLNDEFSYCLLKLKTINSLKKCNDYKDKTGNHITI